MEPGTTTKCLTVVILLPSCVSYGNFSVLVSEDGCASKLVITWPEPLYNFKIFHRRWLLSKEKDKIKLYIPNPIRFEHHLKSHRLRSGDKVEFMARINVPFQVQTHISDKFNHVWADSSARVI